MTAARALVLSHVDHAIDAIESADNRAMAADGPVLKTTDELSVQDMRDIYGALKGARVELMSEIDRYWAEGILAECLGVEASIDAASRRVEKLLSLARGLADKEGTDARAGDR